MVLCVVVVLQRKLLRLRVVEEAWVEQEVGDKGKESD
jgi:hypothetical protein